MTEAEARQRIAEIDGMIGRSPTGLTMSEFLRLYDERAELRASMTPYKARKRINEITHSVIWCSEHACTPFVNPCDECDEILAERRDLRAYLDSMNADTRRERNDDEQ